MWKPGESYIPKRNHLWRQTCHAISIQIRIINQACKGNPSGSPFCFHSRSSSASTSDSPPDIAPSASNPPSLPTCFPFVLRWCATWLCTLVSVTLYISPCPQVDPYPFLFRSPASTVFCSTSRPTAVALTVGKNPLESRSSETLCTP